MKKNKNFNCRILPVIIVALFIFSNSFSQNSMVGDGFGGRLWYQPYNYIVGAYSGYAICGSNHQLFGWGSNEFGQLGNSQTVSTVTPVATTGMTDVRFFTSGYLSAAIKFDGSGWIWSHTPNGYPGNYFTSTPQQVLTNAKFVDAAAYHAAFVKNDGTVWSVGCNYGEFGDGTHPFTNIVTPVQMTGINNAVRVACGDMFTIILLADSSVKQVGPGTDLMQQTIHIDGHGCLPEDVPGLGHDIIDIKCNDAVAFALTSSGQVYSWGTDLNLAYGQLGNGGDHYDPQLIDFGPSAYSIIAISACADGHGLYALDSAGNVYGCGWGNVMGSGSNANANAPVLININCRDILCAETFGYVIKNDNSLWATGGSLSNYPGGTYHGSIFMNQPNVTFPDFINTWVQLDPNGPPMNLCAPTPIDNICGSAVHLGNDTTLCNGQSIILNTGIPNASYTWQDNSSNNDYTVNSAGSYWVTVNEQNCISSDTINVSYKPLPVVALGKDTAFCKTEKLILDVWNAGATYLWQDNSINASYTVTDPATYWVNVSLDGCNNTDTIVIGFIDCNCNMDIPNAITPNGDGINDRWVLSSTDCFRQVNVFVYNRYGSPVYEKYNYQNDWEGTYGSKTLPDGTYYYVIKATRTNGNEQVLKGNITILR